MPLINQGRYSGAGLIRSRRTAASFACCCVWRTASSEAPIRVEPIMDLFIQKATLHRVIKRHFLQLMYGEA
jgi:hypothetical protein